MRTSPTSTVARGRIVELDGLRGVAVLMVLAAHALIGAWPANRPLVAGHALATDGGVVGVQLFFVLSGYLITNIIVREHAQRGRRLRAFYGRRARRLIPALIVVCAAYLAGVLWLSWGRAGAGLSVAHALTYTTDLVGWQHWADSGWLGHCWSLAVEEQFYLVWPVLVLVVWRAKGRQGLVWLCAFMFVAATLARFAVGHQMYELGRWDALFAGGWLAAYRPTISRRMAIAAAVVVGGLAVAAPSLTTWHYLAMTVAAALLVGGARHLACLRVRWLGWFGTISYGLYLWSGLLLRAGWNVPLTMCASVGLAAASWYAVERRFVERPAASGATLPVRQNKGSSGRSDGAGDTDTSEGGRLMSSRRGTASPADATPTA